MKIQSFVLISRIGPMLVSKISRQFGGQKKYKRVRKIMLPNLQCVLFKVQRKHLDNQYFIFKNL